MAAPTYLVDAESKLALLREEFTVANVMIVKLRAEVQMDRDEVEYNRRRARDRYYGAVEDRLRSESTQRRDVLTWGKHVEDLES